jgi:hypothetical protein
MVGGMKPGEPEDQVGANKGVNVFNVEFAWIGTWYLSLNKMEQQYFSEEYFPC